MTDKLTDSEIVRALDICAKSTNGCSHGEHTCEDCYLNGQPMCSAVLLQDAKNLINHLRIENETVKALNGRLVVLADRFRSELKTAKAEAYEEFAEWLKEAFSDFNELLERITPKNIYKAIDDFLKEKGVE